MNGKLNLGDVMSIADITPKHIKIRNAILDDSKIKAYQNQKIEIAVFAKCQFIERGNEIIMEQLYTEEQKKRIDMLDELIENQTRAIIEHYS